MPSKTRILPFYSLALLLIAALAPNTSLTAELIPEQVVILANSNLVESRRVAEFYQEARGIPHNHIIALDLPTSELLSRDQYQRQVLTPLRSELETRNIAAKIRVIATVYGVPLKIAGPGAGSWQRNLLADAEKKRTIARQALLRSAEAASRLPDNKPRFQQSELDLKLSDQEVVAKVDAEIRSAHERILSNQNPQAHMRSLSTLVLKTGGYSNLANVLRPTEASAAAGQTQIEKMKRDLQEAQSVLGMLERVPNEKNRQLTYALTERIFGLSGVLKRALIEIKRNQTSAGDAAFDNELSLLWWEPDEYPLNGRLPNPLHYKLRSQQKSSSNKRLPIMMVSRLDAPTPSLAINMIRNSILAEQKGGPEGTVYLDSQGLTLSSKNERSVWDRSIQDLAWILRRTSSMKVYHDKFPELITDAQNAAYYIGWYSLRNFRGNFAFTPGSIGFHIASEEAVSIRDPDEKGWCKNLLERGITATLGSVAEPYLDSFPLPSEFTGLLFSGRYSLVEVYYLTSKYISWRMVLFGDPLYNPFRNKSIIPIEEIKLETLDKTRLTEFPRAPSIESFPNPLTQRKRIGAEKQEIQTRLNRFFEKLKPK